LKVGHVVPEYLLFLFDAQEKESFWNMASNILNKAKPKVTPPPPKEEPASPKEAASPQKMEGEEPASTTVNGEVPTTTPKEMDVD
jgi:uncharacterized membrane protein